MDAEIPPESPVVRIEWPGGHVDARPDALEDAVERALSEKPAWVAVASSKALGGSCDSVDALREEVGRRLAGVPPAPWLEVMADVVCRGGRPYGVLRVKVGGEALKGRDAKRTVMFLAYMAAGRRRDALRLLSPFGFLLG